MGVLICRLGVLELASGGDSSSSRRTLGAIILSGTKPARKSLSGTAVVAAQMERTEIVSAR